jgi:hypothetical protein
VGLGFCCYGSNSIVEYNLHGGRQTPHSVCVRGQLPRG